MSKPATLEEIQTLCKAIRLPDQSGELDPLGLTINQVKAVLIDLHLLYEEARCLNDVCSRAYRGPWAIQIAPRVIRSPVFGSFSAPIGFSSRWPKSQ